MTDLEISEFHRAAVMMIEVENLAGCDQGIGVVFKLATASNIV